MRNSIFAWLMLVCLAGAAAPAQAMITGIVTVPNSQHIPVGQAMSLTVQWRVTTGVGPLVRSNFGRFGTSDITFARVNTVLSQAAAGGATVTLVETVFVPASVAVGAQKYGLSTITYERDFVDADAVPYTGAVTIDFSSALGAGFGVTREELSFDDGTPVRILQVSDALSARAELLTTGTGLLQAVWEVAGPPSTQGEPVYRPLAQVQQHLVADKPQVLESPPLPTDAPGLYLVRLRITNPTTPFDAPVIRYFAGKGRPGHGLPPAPMALVAPANLALLSADTRFAWQAVKDARIYQLEIYAIPKRASPALPELGGGSREPPATEVNAALRQTPLTGVLVPAKDLQTALSGTVRTHLMQGQAYYWRLLAIDGDGVVVGRSPVRELRTP
jgi:hypothetical protein